MKKLKGMLIFFIFMFLICIIGFAVSLDADVRKYNAKVAEAQKQEQEAAEQQRLSFCITYDELYAKAENEGVSSLMEYMLQGYFINLEYGYFDKAYTYVDEATIRGYGVAYDSSYFVENWEAIHDAYAEYGLVLRLSDETTETSQGTRYCMEYCGYDEQGELIILGTQNMYITDTYKVIPLEILDIPLLQEQYGVVEVIVEESSTEQEAVTEVTTEAQTDTGENTESIPEGETTETETETDTSEMLDEEVMN